MSQLLTTSQAPSRFRDINHCILRVLYNIKTFRSYILSIDVASLRNKSRCFGGEADTKYEPFSVANNHLASLVLWLQQQFLHLQHTNTVDESLEDRYDDYVRFCYAFLVVCNWLLALVTPQGYQLIIRYVLFVVRLRCDYCSDCILFYNISSLHCRSFIMIPQDCVVKSLLRKWSNCFTSVFYYHMRCYSCHSLNFVPLCFSLFMLFFHFDPVCFS